MMRQAALLLLFFGLATSQLLGQKIEQSITQSISAKAAKGVLCAYNLNEDAQRLELSYLIKEKKKSRVVETYSFNSQSLEFVDSKEEEVSYSDKRFPTAEAVKGEKILRILPNPISGQVKMQIGYIEYRYVNRAVIRKFISEQKTKPKGDDGDKLVYVHHRTEEADQNQVRMWNTSYKLNVGDVQLFAIEAAEPSYTRFVSTVYSAKDLSRKHFNPITLPYSYMPVCADDLPNGDIAIVLKPVVKQDFPKWEGSAKIRAKFKLAPSYRYRYLQLNPRGELVHNIEFDMKEPESGWTMAMDIVASDEDDDVIITGTMKPLKLLGPPLAKIFGARPIQPAHKNIGISVVPEHFFVVKLSQGKQVFSRTYPAEQLIANVSMPKGSKLALPGNFKKYFRTAGLVAQDAYNVGDRTLLCLQQANNICHFIQLGRKGEYEANYLLTPERKLILSRPSEIHVNSQGKSFFVYYQRPEEKDPSPAKQQEALMQREGLIVAFNPESKQVEAPMSLSPDASLDPYNGYISLKNDELITLGNGRKKEIVITRISLR